MSPGMNSLSVPEKPELHTPDMVGSIRNKASAAMFSTQYGHTAVAHGSIVGQIQI